jgi:glycosyltransferase involved in cell wall biosynthesis
VKILLVHNFYGSSAPSGENQVFLVEKAMLEKHGHDVQTFTRHSDEIRKQGVWGTIKGALATPWNPWMARAIRRKVEAFRPDIVHVHNSFPLISPSIFHAIGSRAKRVLTLHNYRLVCPAAIPLRSGKVCTECMDQQSASPSLKYGCYRGSRLATFPLAANVALHRWLGTWTHQVDTFIALSEFQKARMASSGIPIDKIHVKPNFYAGNPMVMPWKERSNSVVFVGRLSREKGIETLVRTWRAWGDSAPELNIVGDGPLRNKLQSMARDLPILFLGQLSPDSAQKQIARSRLLILPSECFEGFPIVIPEAFAFGTPVGTSDLGPLPFIIRDGENGVVFPAKDDSALLGVVRAVWSDQVRLARQGMQARFDFEKLYAEEGNYRLLMQIYGEA